MGEHDEIDDLVDWVQQQLAGLPDALRRALVPTRRTSHARSSTAGRGRGGHSDPTADAALDPGPPDHRMRHAAELLKLARDFGRAASRLHRADSDALGRRPDLVDEQGRRLCVNCARFGVDRLAEPGREDRCGACYRYRFRYGEDAGRAVVLNPRRRREV
jgi:hypothetical protein